MKKGQKTQDVQNQESKKAKQLDVINLFLNTSDSLLIGDYCFDSILGQSIQFIREGELLKQLKEYNAKNVILQLSHIANLTGPQSDKRFDLCYLNNQEFEDEPQPAPYDNYVANLCQKIVRQHNQTQNEDDAHDISLLRVDSRSATKRTSFGIKKFSSKLGVFTSNEFRRGSLNYSEKSSPEQYSSRKKINTKEGFFEMSIVRQIKLDEQKPKSYEIMDEQTQILIDRLRGQQKKKEQLKELQKQRQKQKRKEQNQPNKKESIIGINTTDFNRLMNGDISLSHFKDLDYKDTLSKRQNGDHSEISKQSKIKVERLPKTFPEGVKTSFSSVTQSQETQISQMIKEIQKRKLEERGLLYSQGDQQSQNIQEYQNQDLDHLMQSNNLISNQIIQLQDYQIPTRKIISMNYGVAYKDRQTQLVGELKQKTQYKNQEYIEHRLKLQLLNLKYIKFYTLKQGRRLQIRMFIKIQSLSRQYLLYQLHIQMNAFKFKY